MTINSLNFWILERKELEKKENITGLIFFLQFIKKKIKVISYEIYSIKSPI